MTREELEQLSKDTFFDNNKGEIQPAGHRNFNSQLIDFIVQLTGEKLDLMDYTAADVLKKLLTVHGKDSGLITDMVVDHFTGSAKRTYYLNETQYAALSDAMKNDTNNVFYIIKG